MTPAMKKENRRGEGIVSLIIVLFVLDHEKT